MQRENVNNMPESFRETETEEQRARGNQSPPNIVSAISQFADDNLTLVRNISTGLAVAGVVVIARSIRLVTKFQSVSEIPARFIERNVSLRGKVHSITERGVEVEHVPIYLPFVSPLLSKHKGVGTSTMLVHLAGVEVTPEGKQGSMWSCCINEEVLRLGLARTAPIVGVVPDSRLYWRLHKRLHRAEVRAERKGRGLWKQDSLWERVSKAVRDSTLFRLMSRIFKRT
uniref:protein C3orf33 homolog isoform X4 n=1 Tax=Scatophagus argus TaxID=75038 RepID=UPI001ED813F9|nr:protein C3orf33 homolog isoform X4 [Scatophagus argus]